jgi:metal-responsive CopG/Arc/MetJ family transcriptional regulator
MPSLTTITVQIPSKLLRQLQNFIDRGKVKDTNDAICNALRLYFEQQAIEERKRAGSEPSLFADLDELGEMIL